MSVTAGLSDLTPTIGLNPANGFPNGHAPIVRFFHILRAADTPDLQSGYWTSTAWNLSHFGSIPPQTIGALNQKTLTA
jgi:hypothetical protein